jgi:DNA-binding NarL/FixJ family response regulator
MTVLVASDGAAALKSIAVVRPDLVVMDAMMPVMDGFEATRRLKADPANAGLPVIFMTGLSETEHVVAGLAAGAVDYVKKPVVIDELLARIAVHLGNARDSRRSTAALDDSGRSLIAIDSGGALAWATPGARALLARHFAEPAALAGLGAAALRLTDGEERAGLSLAMGGGRIDVTLVAQSAAAEWLFRIAEVATGAEERQLATRFGLTEREAEVLLWISHGKANREISEILGISPRTVNKHLEQVFEKMGVENRASAAAAAVKLLAV